MTDILPPAGWPNVRQLETNEFATGGANGNMNEQAKSLAARSELLKQYAALPYESKTSGYALNERVQLATGDIVRSTIASNVNNPNENMTGWVNVAAWSSIESKPTTVAGYGITDAYTKTEADTLFVEASQIGQPNGVAGLDALGKLDSSEFPLATETALGVAKIATTAIAQAGVNDTDFITPKKLKENTIAFGVDWIDVSASRAINTNYVNTLPRTIIVRICFFVAAQATFTTLQVDGKVRDQAGSQQWATNSFVALSAEVPSGKTFRFDVPTGSVSQINWGEL